MERPDRIERYGILSTLGEGGYGRVYLALDPLTEQRVALKVRASGRESTFAFRQEFLILSMLDHPSLPAVYRLGQHGEQVWLTQEHVRGLPPTLYVRCRGGTEQQSRTLRVLVSLCEGLSVLHRAGVVHCDIKVGNIIVTPGGQARILDLGGAKVLEHGEAIGRGRTMTWSCAAPEQLRRAPITPRTDLYAVGVLAYRLLTGERPYAGHSREEVLESMAVPVEGPIPGTSADLSAVVMSLLAQDPADRPESAEELRASLLRCGGDVPPSLPEPPLPERDERIGGRILIDSGMPGGILHIRSPRSSAVLAGLAGDARALGATVLAGHLAAGCGLAGLQGILREAAALLTHDPPGVSRQRLQRLPIAEALGEHWIHGVVATLLALAESGPVVLILDGLSQAGPEVAEVVASLRWWARDRAAPLLVLADGAFGAAAPAAAEPFDAREAVREGQALCGAGQLSEASVVLASALLQSPMPEQRAQLWLALAEVHLWLHQPGAARQALALSGADGAMPRRVQAGLALSMGQRGATLALLEDDDSLWARVHRAAALAGKQEPLQAVSAGQLCAPEHTMLRLRLFQAQADHAVAHEDPERVLSALREARRLGRQVEAGLSENDRIAWRMYCEVAGLV